MAAFASGPYQKRHPLIFIGKMWANFLNWAKEDFLKNELSNPEDLEIPYSAETIDEALDILKKISKVKIKRKICFFDQIYLTTIFIK